MNKVLLVLLLFIFPALSYSLEIGDIKYHELNSTKDLVGGSGGNNTWDGFGSLLFNSDGNLVIHDTNKTWLYSITNPTPTTEATRVYEFNLDTETVTGPEVCKTPDTAINSTYRWANAHLVLEIATDFYLMFYTVDSSSGTWRIIRAAQNSSANGTFKPIDGFEINKTTAWESNLLEVSALWDKTFENSTTIIANFGYSSYNTANSSNCTMGWANITIDKDLKTVTLNSKLSINPLRNLLISGYSRAYQGGNIDSNITSNDDKLLFYHVYSPYAIAIATSNSTLFNTTTSSRKFLDIPASHALAEVFNYYYWDGRFHLIYETEDVDTGWSTVLQDFTFNFHPETITVKNVRFSNITFR